MKKLKLSIVIGAYSEAGLIANSLSEIKSYLNEVKLLSDTELIVVTADSDDGTKDIVAEGLKQFPHSNHIRPGERVGKGRDIRLGMLASKGQYVVFMDADLATPLTNLAPMLDMLQAGDDVVIGKRSLSTMHSTLTRRLTSQLSNIAIRLILWQNLSDTQCGFKGFSQRAAHSIFSKTKVNGWAFDIEVLALAKKYGLTRQEIVLDDWSDPKPPGEGLVGDSQLRSMVSSLIDALKIRWMLMTGAYDD
ncbi:MAG: glycosyltransferase [Patescibacteria group bacterium]